MRSRIVAERQRARSRRGAAVGALIAFAVALAVAAPAEPRASAGIPWLGTPVQAFQPSPMLYLARSAAVSPDGTILYVVDSQFGFVREYATKTGAYLGSWGWPGSKPGQFNDPRGI